MPCKEGSDGHGTWMKFEQKCNTIIFAVQTETGGFVKTVREWERPSAKLGGFILYFNKSNKSWPNWQQ